MNAPDKIYITVRPSQIANGFVYTTCSNDCPDAKAYIRKDSLLEWAKKKNKRIDTEDGDYSLGYVSAMIDLIDKLNSM